MRVLIAALILFPAFAMAQETPLDRGIVAGCLAETPPRQTVAGCIGDAARQCQTAPGGDTTVGMMDCLMAERDVWDGFLNDEYRETREALAHVEGWQASLLAAQRAWIAFRDAECKLAYDRYEGGSMRVIAGADCQMRQTARRTLELRAIREP